MGSKEEGDERPVHSLWLDAFWIARHPVTNAEYAEFIAAGGYRERRYWTEAGWEWKQRRGRTQPGGWDERKHKRDHPVREITWYEAVAYARWQGAILSSEAQWEKAARGGFQLPTSNFQFVDNPNPERRFPSGDKSDRKKCNILESGIRDTTSVGKYSPEGDSPYGVADMAGNVWEWTSTVYLPYPYRPDDGREDLEDGRSRVLRGGSFLDLVRSGRCSYRISLDLGGDWDSLGCRVCMAAL
jgi:formylglycine-generating enzyme required for sulfatase activity